MKLKSLHNLAGMDGKCKGCGRLFLKGTLDETGTERERAQVERIQRQAECIRELKAYIRELEEREREPGVFELKQRERMKALEASELKLKNRVKELEAHAQALEACLVSVEPHVPQKSAIIRGGGGAQRVSPPKRGLKRHRPSRRPKADSRHKPAASDGSDLELDLTGMDGKHSGARSGRTEEGQLAQGEVEVAKDEPRPQGAYPSAVGTIDLSVDAEDNNM